jgi:TatD DNase family protein
MLSTDTNYPLVDTHCHILHMIDKTTISAFSNSEIQEVRKILHQAALKNVTHIFEIGTSKTDSILSIELAKLFPSIFPVIGVHPHEATDAYQDDVLFLKNLLEKHADTIVGIGECGLDKHYPGHNLSAQMSLFEAQIELALTYDKALVVHTRDAEDETYAILERYKDSLKRVTIHCFSNSLNFAQEVTRWGWFLGIGGAVTYPKNDLLRTVVKTVGASGLVLETDAPFLPPQIIRGKQNSPEHIHTIAEYSAQLLGITLEEIARITTANATALFQHSEIGKNS